MKGKGFYIAMIAVLILINLGTIFFMWTHRPREEGRFHERKNSAEFLIRHLNLTQQQKEAVMKMRDSHLYAMHQLQMDDRELHNRFFDLLQNFPTDSMLVDRVADSMANNRKSMEILTFEHFQKIRAILNDEQKKRFDRLFHETLNLILPTPPPPPMPPPPVRN